MSSRTSDLGNRSLPHDVRARLARSIGRLRDPGGVEALLAVALDTRDCLEVRLTAIYGLCLFEKHTVYPRVLELLGNGDPVIRREVIRRLPLLKDSRTTFPLINLFNSLDLNDDDSRRTACSIIRSIALRGDPRAAEWFESLKTPTDPKLSHLAELARRRCSGNSRFVYTFNGSEEERQTALDGQECLGIEVTDFTALKTSPVSDFLADERQGDLAYVTFVILAADADDPYSGCRLVLAPRRSEHFMAARGQDVLAAGEMGFDGDKVEETSNQSAGYLPAISSFAWVLRSLEQAKIPCALQSFSLEWPYEGYLSDGFLQLHPLYEPLDR